jgi:hypothetical protein
VNNYTFHNEIQLDAAVIEKVKKKSVNNSEATKDAVNKFVEKYDDAPADKKDNKLKPKF